MCVQTCEAISLQAHHRIILGDRRPFTGDRRVWFIGAERDRKKDMKIITYNVNGLRQRISQYGCLLKLLESLDADIICFQETKLRRQELTADVAMADGYESFFSCTCTSGKGRMGYSGVATFCRVKSAFSSQEVALPVAAEEGFTGILENSQTRKDERPAIAQGLEEFTSEELLAVDSEGRCIITDHTHFVLFNLYGPRADSDDIERSQFKLNFFKILQKRWECLLRKGKRIIVVGDLNIAPAAIDRSDAGPEFEKNEFRRWLRSILAECGGSFYDVFRAKHPDRRGAYTCWPSNTGAEEFNHGSRIDHILSAGSCLHKEHYLEGNFITCHVKECDILTQYQRWKPGNTPRWKGGRNIKLEGSDHVPVYISLVAIPDVSQHSTPSLSSRYITVIRGVQQTIVSVLMKRRVAEQVKTHSLSSLLSDENIGTQSCCESKRGSFISGSVSLSPSGESFSSNLESEGDVSKRDECSGVFIDNAIAKTVTKSGNRQIGFMSGNETKKKARKSQLSQLSVRSFFHRSSDVSNCVDNSGTDISLKQADVSTSNNHSDGNATMYHESSSFGRLELKLNATPQDQKELNACFPSEKEKNNTALREWQRIQQLMQNSIPICKGHSEPCVARVVKKPGPNFGRRFFVCARAEGPASNPEANCGYFKWAASKSRHK